MKTKAARSDNIRRCMYCGNFIPAGMTFRQVYDEKGNLVGDRCYQKCQAIKKTVFCFEGEQLELKEVEQPKDGE